MIDLMVGEVTSVEEVRIDGKLVRLDLFYYDKRHRTTRVMMINYGDDELKLVSSSP